MKYDWAKIRAEYISTKISQREIAKKYGVSPAQVARRASNEDWAEARTNFASVTSAKAEQKLIEKKSDTLAEHLANIAEASNNMSALILKATQAEKNFRRDRKIDTKAMKNLTGALTDLLNVLRDVYETPNAVARAKMAKDEGGGPVEVAIEYIPPELPEEDALPDEPPVETKAEEEGNGT